MRTEIISPRTGRIFHLQLRVFFYMACVMRSIIGFRDGETPGLKTNLSVALQWCYPGDSAGSNLRGNSSTVREQHSGLRGLWGDIIRSSFGAEQSGKCVNSGSA